MAHPGPLPMRARIARVAESLQRLLERTSDAEIARRLGTATSTILRRDSDLARYPADEFLMLVDSDEGLGAEVVSFARRESTERPQSDAVALHQDLLGEVGQSCNLSKRIVDAMADQRLTREERATIRALLKRRRELDDRVLAELDAADGVHA